MAVLTQGGPVHPGIPNLDHPQQLIILGLAPFVAVAGDAGDAPSGNRQSARPHRRGNILNGHVAGVGIAQAELLRDLSPIHRLDRVRAPTIVLHGANDTNVPVVEAEQVVETVLNVEPDGGGEAPATEPADESTEEPADEGVGVGYPGPWIGGPYIGGGWYGRPFPPGYYPYHYDKVSKIEYAMIVPFADF